MPFGARTPCEPQQLRHSSCCWLLHLRRLSASLCSSCRSSSTEVVTRRESMAQAPSQEVAGSLETRDTTQGKTAANGFPGLPRCLVLSRAQRVPTFQLFKP